MVFTVGGQSGGGSTTRGLKASVGVQVGGLPGQLLGLAAEHDEVLPVEEHGAYGGACDLPRGAAPLQPDGALLLAGFAYTPGIQR